MQSTDLDLGSTAPVILPPMSCGGVTRHWAVQGGKGPATTFELAAALDGTGEVTALQFVSRAFSGTDILPQPADPGNLLAAQLMGIPNKTGGDEFSPRRPWRSISWSYRRTIAP